MDEVYKFSDRVVVFRNGELVASVVPAESTPAELIAYMLGQEKEEFVRLARRVGRDDAVVELRDCP